MDGESVSSEAEILVLGACLLSGDALEDALEAMQPADFSDSRFEAVMEAAMTVHRRGVPLDPVVVADQVPPDVLARMGGMTSLTALAGRVVSTASTGHYAAIVKREATLRRMRAIGSRLAAISGSDLDPVEALNAYRAELDGLVDTDHSDLTHAQAVYESIEALDEPPGMGTPWGPFTQAIAGWRPGNLYVFGARPSVGKSVLGVNAALDVARRGVTAMVFSLEMSRVDIYHRMLSSVGSVNMHALQHRSLSGADYDALAKAATHIADLPLVVDDSARVSVPRIEARVRARQRLGRVGLVVVDYLQLLQPSTPGRDGRRVEVDDIARDLQLAAKELGVPIMALAQLNRATASRTGEDRMPTLTDLRESGAIEQAADVVALLHRDIDNPLASGDLAVLLAKNRHGPTSRFSLVFQGWYARALDADQARARQAG